MNILNRLLTSNTRMLNYIMVTAQLNEVRSTSIARLLCDNGESVEEIQPLALLNVSKK